MRKSRVGVAAAILGAMAVGGLDRADAQPAAPAYLRDGKVWFEVRDSRTGTPTDDFAWPARKPLGSTADAVPQGGYVQDCVRVDRWAHNLGVRPESYESAGEGTFTLDACEPLPDAAPRGGGGPDPWAVLLGEAHLAEGRPPVRDDVYVPLQTYVRQDRLWFFGRADVGLDDLDREPDASFSSEKFTFSLNGQPLGEEQGDTSAAEINELFDLIYEERARYAEIQVGARYGGDVTTTATALVGRAEAMFLYGVPQETPGIRRTEWNGDGNVLEVGLDQRFPIGDGSFVELGGRYGLLLETSVTRSPGLSASGGRITEDRGDLKRTSRSAHVLLGHEWGARVAVWAGAQAAWDTIRLAGSATAAFEGSDGLFEQSVEFVNEFESNAVRPFAGIEVRVAGPVYARAQYVRASSGSTLSVGLGAGRRRR